MISLGAELGGNPAPRIVRVTRDGAEVGWAALMKALVSVGPEGFIAVDTEFTGWGADPRFSAEDLRERYKAVTMVASTRALVSLGVAVFDPIDDSQESGKKEKETTQTKASEKSTNESKRSKVQDIQRPKEKVKRKYSVAAFDILLKCEDDFVISPDAASFLLSHGLDLNEMFTSGIGYRRACSDLKKKIPVTAAGESFVQVRKESQELSRESAKKQKRYLHRMKKKSKRAQTASTENGRIDFEWAPMPRGLLWRLGLAQVPIVVHNGFFDLAFLYAAFHSRMPGTLQEFCESLLDVLPAGIYDTKHIAERVASEKASYLAYVFAKARRKCGRRISTETADYLPLASATCPPRIEDKTIDRSSAPLCQVFAVRGFCKKGKTCPLSHSVEKVLDQEENGELPDVIDTKGLFKTNAKLIKNLEETLKSPNEKIKLPKKRRRAMEPGARATEAQATNAHSAGYDAYCTGYGFAAYAELLSPSSLEKAQNKIYLIHKQMPLLLCKSSFKEEKHLEQALM